LMIPRDREMVDACPEGDLDAIEPNHRGWGCPGSSSIPLSLAGDNVHCDQDVRPSSLSLAMLATDQTGAAVVVRHLNKGPQRRRRAFYRARRRGPSASSAPLDQE